MYFNIRAGTDVIINIGIIFLVLITPSITCYMNNKLYINNKTNKPMHATISDNYTGNSVRTYELHPGANEITVAELEEGVYMIELEDCNHDIFYRQKLVRD